MFYAICSTCIDLMFLRLSLIVLLIVWQHIDNREVNLIIIITLFIIINISFMHGIYTYIPETESLGNTVLKLFCCYYSWCLYR